MILALLLGTSILVAGQPVEVGRPVVLWSDPEGFNGYAEQCVEDAAASSSPCCDHPFRRFSERKGLAARTPEALQELVHQLVLHLDGCVNSRSCFYSMHDLPRAKGGCGLSAHFMIDADGTIYQTLDVLERAWHAEEVNSISIGVEICNRGDASRNELDRLPADYRAREVKEITINGHTLRAFEFRPEQYDSVIALSRALVRVFPQIRPVIPEQGGQPLLQTLPHPLDFAGIVGHLHVDLQRQKWDPGAFDWRKLTRALHGLHFPLPLRHYSFVPDEPGALGAALSVYLRHVSERASGFFPLAPTRLWHSGVHLRAASGEPVHAPARGRLVAARLAQKNGSSTSFVLLRHELRIADEPVLFFTLLAHLAPEPVSKGARVPWIRDLAAGSGEADARLRAQLEQGDMALLDRPTEAGDVVGLVGQVRRGTEQGPEVHFEIFSPQRLTTPLGRTFHFIDAAADGPIARRAALVEAIWGAGDEPPRAEGLRAFFHSGDPLLRGALARLAVRHAHEWGDRLAEDAYVAAPELARLPESARRALYRDAMAPYLFWTDALSEHVGLPRSQVVYFYHPLTFLTALGAAARDLTVRFPARAPLEDRDLEPAPLSPATLGDWTTHARPSTWRPIFGPIIDAEAAPRRKADIPLILLPSISE